MTWRTQRAAFAVLAVCAFAALTRDAYRDAYRAWRQADPNLERDAATSGPALGANADHVANEAAKYIAARAAYLTQSAALEQQNLAWLNQSRAPIKSDSQAAQIIAAETVSVRHSLDSYGDDHDPGIQQVRNMLDRENLALTSLAAITGDGQKAAEQVRSATVSEESARLKALAQSEDSGAALKRQIAATNQEGSAWAEYYRKLSDAARSTTPAPVAPPPATAAPAPEPRVPAPPITPLPMGRYTGAWTYPIRNGMYHGPEPEFVDMVIHEEDGRAEGTLFGRFKVTSGDPVIRFDFSGEFQKTRNQVFHLETSDGTKGTVELIPGPAFNLLEIYFRTDSKPGKINQANVVLVKK